MTETTKAEATVGHEDAFDIDKALTEKGFGEFLAVHDDYDSFDMDNSAFISEKYTQFKLQEKTAEVQVKLCKEYFSKQVGFEMKGYDEECIKEVIYEKSLKNPEEVRQRAERIKDYIEVPAQIAELEKRLAELGDTDILSQEMEDANTRATQLEIAKKMSSKIGKAKIWAAFIGNKLLSAVTNFEKAPDAAHERAQKAKDVIDAYKNVKSEYGKISGEQMDSFGDALKERIVEIESTIKAIVDVAEKKRVNEELFAQARKEIFGGVADYKSMVLSTQSRIKFFFDEMIANNDIKSFDMAQEKLDKLKSVAKDPLGMDLVGAFDGAETLESLQIKIDSRLQTQVQVTMERTIKDIPPGDSSMGNLEKIIMNYAGRQKIGSKQGAEMKKFVTDSVAHIRGKLDNSPESRLKKLYLARILIKLRK